MTRFDFGRGDRLHRVELIERGGGSFRALVTVGPLDGATGADAHALEGAGIGEAEGSVAIELHAVESRPGLYSVLVGSDVYDAVVDRVGDARTVSLPSGQVTLEHLDPYRAGGPGGAGAMTGPQGVASPMPGRVIEVSVATGDAVSEGQTLVVVEAMKMANELRSPVDGVVSAVTAKAGDAVEAGKALVVVEPAGE